MTHLVLLGLQVFEIFFLRFDDQGNAAHTVVGGVALAVAQMLAKPLPMIRGKDDDRVFAQAQGVKRDATALLTAFGLALRSFD